MISHTGRRSALFLTGALVFAACVITNESEVTEPTETVVGTAAGSTTTDSTLAPPTSLKIAFVLPTPVNNRGWSWTHDQGAKHVQDLFGDEVQITTLESVDEGPTSLAVFERLADDGNLLIFGAAVGYMDSMVKAAENHPEVVFMHNGGTVRAPNLGTYSGAAEEARYLSGLAAGATTEANIIGYVAAIPLPEVLRGINAFTLGAREANADVEVRVVWTGSWFDPPIDGAAAQLLLDGGADVIAMHQHSAATGLTAAAAGAKWVGNNTDMEEVAPDAWLTAPTWDWGPLYVEIVQAVIDHTWVADDFYGSMSDGMVDIAPLGSSVPEDVRELIATRRREIIAGTFSVFPALLVDQDGVERILGDLSTMDYFISGVVGSPSG